MDIYLGIIYKIIESSITYSKLVFSGYFFEVVNTANSIKRK